MCGGGGDREAWTDRGQAAAQELIGGRDAHQPTERAQNVTHGDAEASLVMTPSQE